MPILEFWTCSARGVRVALVIAKSFSIISARTVVGFTFAAPQSLNAAPMNLEECEELFTTALPSLLTPYHMLSATSYPRRAITLWCIAAKKEGKVIGIQLIVPAFYKKRFLFFFVIPTPFSDGGPARWPATTEIFARSSLVFDRSKYWVTKLTLLFFCNFLFVNGPGPWGRYQSDDNFVGWRFKANRAFNAYGWRLLSGHLVYTRVLHKVLLN